MIILKSEAVILVHKGTTCLIRKRHFMNIGRWHFKNRQCWHVSPSNENKDNTWGSDVGSKSRIGSSKTSSYQLSLWRRDQRWEGRDQVLYQINLESVEWNQYPLWTGVVITKLPCLRVNFQANYFPSKFKIDSSSNLANWPNSHSVVNLFKAFNIKAS